MLQRVKQNREARESIRLLTMRDQMQKQLGESTYREMTAIYLPFVKSQIDRYHCPRVAAAHVVQLLDSQQQTDQAVQRLVMCAALDVALGESNLPLVS